MHLDIILPFALDYTPEGKFVPNLGSAADYEAVGRLQDHIDNLECVLIIEFTQCGEMTIDYIREDGVYVMAETYEFASTTSSEKEFVKAQYEIAAILGIKTIDL